MSQTPNYYNYKIQPHKIISDLRLNFNLGNVFKYVARAGKKNENSKEKDLSKAIDYLEFEIEFLKTNTFCKYPIHEYSTIKDAIEDWGLSKTLVWALEYVLWATTKERKTYAITNLKIARELILTEKNYRYMEEK